MTRKIKLGDHVRLKGVSNHYGGFITIKDGDKGITVEEYSDKSFWVWIPGTDNRQSTSRDWSLRCQTWQVYDKNLELVEDSNVGSQDTDR